MTTSAPSKPRAGRSALCPKCSSRLITPTKGILRRFRLKCNNKLCNRKYIVLRSVI